MAARWDSFPRDGESLKGRKELCSFFISEFPERDRASNIFDVFGCIGSVVEVSISPRKNKWGKRFGFARFPEVEDQRLWGVKLDNVIFYGRNIHANIPRFERNKVIGELLLRKGRTMGGNNLTIWFHREAGVVVKRFEVGRNISLRLFWRASVGAMWLLLQRYRSI